MSQQRLFPRFSKETFKQLHEQEKQKQMKKKTPKKRIRLMVECHSVEEKIYLLRSVEKLKKQFKKTKTK